MMEARTIILGGSGGLGRAVARHFPDASNWSPDTGVDASSEESVSAAVERIRCGNCRVERLINCAGINELQRFDELNLQDAIRLFNVNALAFPRVVQALRATNALAPGAILCNVISNAAHMPMTHSLAYNASKAAQEIVTRQLAREMKEYSIFGVNPNKLSGTGMSRIIEKRVLALRGWTEKEAHKYQLAALPAGVETPPESCAAFIAEMMRPIHHPFVTGCIFPYGGPM